MPDTVNLPVLLLDLPTTLRFLRSAAVAKAMSDTTSLKWVEYNDSTALNVAYTLLFWKEKPGTVEVQTARREEVDRRATQMTAEFLSTAVKRSFEGGAQLANYLAAMDRVRTGSLENLQSMFGDAAKINREVAQVTANAIRDLARIKLASDLIVKIGAPPVVSIPYSILATFIKEMNAGGTAKVVAWKCAQEPLKEGAKTLAEGGSELAAEIGKDYGTMLHNAELDLRRQADLIARRSATPKSIAKAATRAEAAAAQQGAARTGRALATGGKWALKGVATAFVAWDAWESWTDYQEATQGL